MARYSETSTTWETLFDENNVEYNIEVEMTRTEIRAGTYSSDAADPDEYYGEWHTEAVILGAFKLDDEGTEEWIDAEDLPVWIIEDIEAGYED